MEEQTPTIQIQKDSFKRSLVKSISYRIIIICLDFTTVYLFTGQVKLAVGFMLVSNVYTTVAYFLHERLWDRIKWGKSFSLGKTS
jgi:uncharacterized membrane protein